ncbi:hypothetical protein CCACVL1_19364 [Corchorus capsularis]|uniref:PGG domain-containing protein n=1 Tax=Corchorus capsularis TaxID=210143 RepID=A0A1R3HGY7_COCAP|nr:hypothetical protein CCACVL1_19364 [Corchorus capsularis]
MVLIKSTGKSWFRYFQYDEDRDSPGDVRNLLLVIATLIAAVTFQAGVNPPGGVWQDTNGTHVAGRAIYASEPGAFYVFLISNTMALSASVLVIISLTYGFPFHLEIVVATVSMIVTYGSAIFAVTPSEFVRFRYVTAAAAVPFVVRCLIHIFNKLRERYSVSPPVDTQEIPLRALSTQSHKETWVASS